MSAVDHLAHPRRVVLISNPRSGHNRDHFDAIARRVADVPNISHLITGSAAEVPALLCRLAGEPPPFLAINGGDGTAAHIFGHLLETWPHRSLPTLILLPGGTANMTAGDVGCRGPLRKAVERLCQWSAGGQSRGRMVERRVLRLVPAPGADARFGMFLGAGVIIQATEHAHSEIHARGLRDEFSLGLGLLRTLWGIARGDPGYNRPLPVDIAVDGGPPNHHRLRILAASTLNRLFLGSRPFWGAGGGQLQVSFVSSDATHFLRRFTPLLWGLAVAGATPVNGYHSLRVGRLGLAMDDRINLDGEIIPLSRQAGPAELSTVGPLRFWQL